MLVLHRRLAQDRQWQLEGMRAMQRERDALIARISALAWSADGYASLMQGVVDTLARHDEIISCSVGRPDAKGSFAYEAVGGTAFADYLRALAHGEVMAITADADSAMGRGPSGRAWRSGGIERCLHFATDRRWRRGASSRCSSACAPAWRCHWDRSRARRWRCWCCTAAIRAGFPATRSKLHRAAQDPARSGPGAAGAGSARHRGAAIHPA
ncbi:diguanylate phosphodiesterase with GAF sensor(s) [mine drainage metagenome]|uniref:Diguanylate phosphodiesterase with GAF sensor(S) n=1 Tax=mine drainage metagenome TaxID=410659 RepID=T1AZU1_9ZZZZ